MSISFTVSHDDGSYMTGPERKSTLDREIDEMENIFLNIQGNDGNADVFRDPSAVYLPAPPTISLQTTDIHDSVYPTTPPNPCSSNGSYSTGPLLSAPPSPSLGGFEGPRSLPDVDWSEVLHSKMAMRSRSESQSHSSFHGEDALSAGPPSPSCGSVAGDHFEHFTHATDSSYDGASSPGLQSVSAEFRDLAINTDIHPHEVANDPNWIPSPGMLAPGPHHVGVRRWSSAGNPSHVRTHQRFASQQLPTASQSSDYVNAGMGRGRSLTRTVSAPGSTPPSRRHSPYPAQNVDTVYETQTGEFAPFHQVTGAPDAFGVDNADVTIVKETVTPTKIARAAAMRRKNPAVFTCDHCTTTFTTKFKRDSHVDAHEGRKEFSCSSCGKAFTRKSDCVRHEKNTKKCTPITP